LIGIADAGARGIIDRPRLARVAITVLRLLLLLMMRRIPEVGRE
jgi:hypothetical protein